MPAAMSSANAANKVFNLNELLAEILSYLPAKDVLLDQRVCKKWKSIIAASPQIQRTLFKDPVAPGKGWLVADMAAFDEIEEFGHDPLIIRETMPPPGAFSLANGFAQKAELNELLLTRAPSSPDRESYTSPHHRAFYGETVWFRDMTHRIDGNKSYMNMFITQPPCYAISFRPNPPTAEEMLLFDIDHDPDERVIEYFPCGVTYGKVIETMQEVLADAGRSADEDGQICMQIPGVLVATEEDEAHIAASLEWLASRQRAMSE